MELYTSRKCWRTLLSIQVLLAMRRGVFVLLGEVGAWLSPVIKNEKSVRRPMTSSSDACSVDVWWLSSGPYRMVVDVRRVGTSSSCSFVRGLVLLWQHACGDGGPLWYSSGELLLGVRVVPLGGWYGCGFVLVGVLSGGFDLACGFQGTLYSQCATPTPSAWVFRPWEELGVETMALRILIEIML